MKKNRSERKRWPLLVFLSVVTGIVSLLIGVYLGGGSFFVDRFLPNTVVSGTDISSLTLDEANKLLGDNTLQATYTIKENDKEVAKIDGEKLKVSFDFTDELKAIIDNQETKSWPLRMLKAAANENVESESVINVETKEVQNFVNSLGLKKQDRDPSKNAEVVFKDDKFVIEPEVVGTVVDGKKLVEGLAEAVVNGDQEISLNDYYIQPKVKKDDADLKAELDKKQKIFGNTITYLIQGEEVKVPQSTIVSWITEDAEGNVSIDYNSVYSYVAQLSQEHGSVYKTRDFKTTSGSVVSVPPGTLGWEFNYAAETQAIIDSLMAFESIKRAPLIYGNGDPATDDIGNSYVEVSIKDQYLWVYQDGKVILETSVVTGKPSTPTPTGAFVLWSKESPSVLTGPDFPGQPKKDWYKAPVNYWMPIDYAGIGLHDANWQPYFGGTGYLDGIGSHGCINLPPNFATQLFGAIGTGTPVIVY